MTIQEHIELLQAIHRLIDGVKDAPDNVPDRAPAVTPMILVAPDSGVGVVGQFGESCMTIARVYRVTIFGEPAGLNTFGQKSEEVYGIVEKILTEYHLDGPVRL